MYNYHRLHPSFVPAESKESTAVPLYVCLLAMLQKHPDNIKSDTEDGYGAGGVPRALVDGTDFDGMAFSGVNELDPAMRECFFMLGVLAKGTIAPFDMLSNLWNQVRRRHNA